MIAPYSISSELEIFGHIIYACVLGLIIGFERERHQKNASSAGIRTYGSIALGACVFGLIGMHSTGDPTRVAAQVVSGIGFLGGGIIFRQGDMVKGLTTAATLWATASVGLAVAVGMRITAALITLLIFLLLYLSRLKWWKRISAKSD
jgi:putative Mg2+ transporter-C (MgtC) family protein